MRTGPHFWNAPCSECAGRGRNPGGFLFPVKKHSWYPQGRGPAPFPYCREPLPRFPACRPRLPQQRQALADALEDVQAALREMEPFRWRISESTISAYRAAVPSLVVQKDNTLSLVYDAGGLAAEERYAAQQISMEELLDTYAHLSESIAKEN